jgi:transcriptional regulator with XRE-family HTH domain
MPVYNDLWGYWFAFQGKSKKKLSQAWLADKAGISVFTLRRYLNNTIKSYDPEVVDKLCKTLEIPIEKFFYQADNEPSTLERTQLLVELSTTHEG